MVFLSIPTTKDKVLNLIFTVAQSSDFVLIYPPYHDLFL